MRGAQDELREFAQGIRPPLLGSGGLRAAIPVLAARGSVPVQVDITVGRLAPAIESAIYFVCAEGLTNVAKHSAADHAWVSVSVDAGRRRRANRGRWDRRRGPQGLGLRGLADRVEALGGSLRITTPPQAGPSSRRASQWRLGHES